jgi:hypothetical protein
VEVVAVAIEDAAPSIEVSPQEAAKQPSGRFDPDAASEKTKIKRKESYEC